MRKLAVLCAWLCAMAVLIAASPVRAEYVSPNGNDANGCSETAPCATFQRAINEGGAQINCLGSGDYGPVVIQTSLIIDCGTGNVGNVSVTGPNTNAITINTQSTATIVLRHLSLNGENASGAIVINTQGFPSGVLIIQDCAIYKFPGGGINFTPSSGRGTLQISDTVLYGNGFGAVVVQPSAGQIAGVTLNRVEIVATTGDGLDLIGSGVVAGTMRDSLVGTNSNAGVFVNAHQAFFTIEESSVVDNLTFGIDVDSPGAVINVGSSTIGGNGTGVKSFAGSAISFGNNQMSANGTNGSFTSTAGLQ